MNLARLAEVRRWVIPNGYAGGPAGDKRTTVMVRLDDLHAVLPATREEGDAPSTLGEMAAVLRLWKEAGVTRGSMLYVMDQVWWEEDALDEDEPHA